MHVTVACTWIVHLPFPPTFSTTTAARCCLCCLYRLPQQQELSACHHPHIVELKDVFLTPTHLAAVLEYVEGEDLQTFLSNTGGR